MKLNDRQKKRIAQIIKRHVGWMVGWSVDYDTREENYRDAADDIARYLQRSFRVLDKQESK